MVKHFSPQYMALLGDSVVVRILGLCAYQLIRPGIWERLSDRDQQKVFKYLMLIEAAAGGGGRSCDEIKEWWWWND